MATALSIPEGFEVVNQSSQASQALSIPEGFEIVQPEAPRTTAGEVARPSLRAAKSVATGTLGSAGDLAQEAVNFPSYLGRTGARAIEKAIYGDNIIAPYDTSKINTVSPAIREGFDSTTGGLTKSRNKTEENLEIGQEILGGFVGPATISKTASTVGNTVKNVGKNITQKIDGVSNVVKGFYGRTVDELDQRGLQLKDQASNLYKAMRDSNAVIRPQAANKIAVDIEKAVMDSGKLNSRLHGDTLSVLDDIKGAVKSGNIGLEELDQYRQLLSDVVTKNTDIGGKLNPDAFKATLAINKLDDVVDALKPNYLIKSGGKNAVQLLNSARQQYKTYRKFDTVSNIIKQADGDPNRLKSALQKFVSNPKKLRGFTQDEVKSLKAAAANSGGEKLLKSIGKFGFDLGTSRTAGNAFLPASFSIAGAAGAPGAAPLVAAGTIARQLQKYSALGKVDNVLELIESSAKSSGPESAANLISKIPDKKIQKQVIDKFLGRVFAVSNLGNLTNQNQQN